MLFYYWTTIKVFNVPNKTDKEGKPLSLVFCKFADL